MPYLTCSSCGLRTYAVSEGTCPSCGTALRSSKPVAGPRPAGWDRDGQLRAKLAMACRELDADTALLSEIRNGREHVRWGAGEAGYIGVSVPLSDTVCARLLDGRIGNIVSDAMLEESLNQLAGVTDGTIRAYIGVPFETEDARAYVLCCLAREARPDLGEADVRFLQGVAESLRPLLEPVDEAARTRSPCSCSPGAARSSGGATVEQAEGAVRLQKVGSFDSPVYVTSPPADNSRLFVVEQGGTVRVVKDGKTLGTPFLDVSDKITTGSEQGLLSIAFAPDYASSGLFYVFYTDNDGDEAVVEYKRRSEDVADPGSARQLMKVADPEPNHNGGLLLFGPDNHLYIGIGDGGGAGDQHGSRGNGQSLGTLLGKILRIDPKAGGGRPYTIPSDNPFVNRSGAKGEIYSYGLRNPWRFSFDRSTGDLTIGDVGQNEVEEIDFVRKGKGRGRELRLAPVRGQRPLRARRDARPARSSR